MRSHTNRILETKLNKNMTALRKSNAQVALRQDSNEPSSRIIDGRLHLQHGPIDLIVSAFGETASVSRAYRAARKRFSGLLFELVAELPQLRTPVGEKPIVTGVMAKRMVAAASYFQARFITPMAAVAGAVADEILNCMRSEEGLQQIYVNNGGDIALWLNGGEVFRLGVIPDIGVPGSSAVPATVRLTAQSRVGGIATSGWRGRSQSLGVADAVTVFAADAAGADAAATMIANAVDVDSNKVRREPARELHPDSDLGARRVTVSVDQLSSRECEAALEAGVTAAERMVADSRILAAILFLQARVVVVGDLKGGGLTTDDRECRLQTIACAGP